MHKIVLLLLCVLACLPLSVFGQFEVQRGGCTPSPEGEEALARGTFRALPAVLGSWDSERTYRQMVVLVSFADTDFKEENSPEFYNSLFNEKGFNKRNGPGCVADYFREQSGGLFNLQFDVFGPFKVSRNARLSDNLDNGKDAFSETMKMLIAQNPELDFSPYDWNGNGRVNQVVIVYAGFPGNMVGYEGYVWPNTSYISSLPTNSGQTISNYSASGELWPNNASCGLGTICHEFSHSLGLPDIYPTVDDAGYSVMDEWDLMDGGNYTNFGWCPPNYTALEKMLLGWHAPIELTEPTTITDMASVSEGGESYIVRHTDNEFFLIENRQWQGWDYGIPGRGLVVTHVDYDKTVWNNNNVNNSRSHRRYELVHADNMDYDAWAKLIGGKSPYSEKPWLHNKHLSSSAYPWQTDSTDFVNRELTDESTPASTTFAMNAAGAYFLSKPITNITMTADGRVSFDFMGGSPVMPPSPGDANGDGVVNVSDVTAIITRILGKTSEPFFPDAADVNGDGIFNVTDVTLTINIILGNQHEQ